MKIKNIQKLIKITTFSSLFLHTALSFLTSFTLQNSSVYRQDLIKIFSLAVEVMKFFNDTHRENLVLY